MSHLEQTLTIYLKVQLRDNWQNHICEHNPVLDEHSDRTENNLSKVDVTINLVAQGMRNSLCKVPNVYTMQDSIQCKE